MNWAPDLWYHLISSSRNRRAIWSLGWFFISISCWDKMRVSAILSRSSIIVERHCYSFLYIPVVCLAHPVRNRLMARILKFHLWIGVQPTAGLSHEFLTISAKPSRCNHPNSNLNGRRTVGELVELESRMMGAWSESDSIRSRARTVTIGNFNSHSVSMSTRSSCSYVGTGRLLAQVNCRPDILASRRFKLSITALNKKGQCVSKRSLFFSSWYLRI